jgi:carbon storage regulator
MLVLSRKAGERILIGDNITVTIVRLTGNTVRIGIEAPIDIAVIRSELRDSSDTAVPQDGRQFGHQPAVVRR